MTRCRFVSGILAVCLSLVSGVLPARADDLRNLKRGEPVPAYRLPTADGAIVEGEAFKGSVVVMVCLAAEQRSSEVAAMESATVVRGFGEDPVKLVHVTADAVHKAYFQKFRQERKLDVPLALDADRALYGKLGLIVFPTTIIVNKDGKLAHVISLCGRDYSHVLDGYIRHALGKLTDEQLAERLKAHSATDSSPKSVASTHRALARTLREKGQLDGAREELVKAREQDPKNAEILLDLADLDLSAGNLDETKSLVQSVLDTQPDHRRAKQIKGIALFRSDEFTDAETVLLEALVLNPDPARVHYYLGRVYEQQGKSAKALEHYREALRRFLNESDLAPAPAKAPK